MHIKENGSLQTKKRPNRCHIKFMLLNDWCGNDFGSDVC